MVRASANQQLKLYYLGAPSVRPAIKVVDLEVPARTAFRVSDRRLLNGQSVTFSGRLAVPPTGIAAGKLVELQTKLSGRWQTFRTIRTDAQGRWRSAYRFRRTRGLIRYRFRARLAARGLIPLRHRHDQVRSRYGPGPLMRKHLTFANVTSLMALFVALGGTSYAVSTIGTKEIKNNSVRSIDVRNGQLTSRDVKRGSLGARASRNLPRDGARANRLGGKTASQLTCAAPWNGSPTWTAASRPTPRPALATARAGGVRARQAEAAELPGAISFTDNASGRLAPGGEMAANVYHLIPARTTQLRALVVINQSGDIDTVPNTFAGGRPSAARPTRSTDEPRPTTARSGRGPASSRSH